VVCQQTSRYGSFNTLIRSFTAGSPIFPIASAVLLCIPRLWCRIALTFHYEKPVFVYAKLFSPSGSIRTYGDLA
jgi:hypothetical protein